MGDYDKALRTKSGLSKSHQCLVGERLRLAAGNLARREVRRPSEIANFCDEREGMYLALAAAYAEVRKRGSQSFALRYGEEGVRSGSNCIRTRSRIGLKR